MNNELEAEIREAEDIFAASRFHALTHSGSQHLKGAPNPMQHADEAETTPDEDKSVDAWLQDVMTMQHNDAWADVNQPTKVTSKPSLLPKPLPYSQNEKCEDSDPRVSAMAKLYERQMKARKERERMIVVEREQRNISDMADCTFSPRVNDRSRRILAGGSAPGWAALKVKPRDGEALFQALGWDEQLINVQDQHKTPTKSSPTQGKIAPAGHRDRVNDFGERLYGQAMKLKELKSERARLQDQENQQLRHFVARRFRSTSPHRESTLASPSEGHIVHDQSSSIFNQRLRFNHVFNRDFLQPSSPNLQPFDWPEFVERQESFIRNREEKLRVEREQRMKPKPAPMSPGSRKITNGLRLSYKYEIMDSRQEATFNQWSQQGARSKSLPRSPDNRKGSSFASTKQPQQPSSLGKILRPSARNKEQHGQGPEEIASDGRFGGRKSSVSSEEHSLTFKPSITARAARRRPSSITELHDGGRSRREAWRQEQKLLREYEEAQELTWRPSISPSSYHKTSLIRRDPEAFVNMWRAKQAVIEERRKRAIQEKEEAELADCTFKPSINQSLPTFVLSKPQRSLAEHSHYDSHYDSHSYAIGTSLIQSLESGRTSSTVSRQISHSGHHYVYEPEESMNQESREETLQKALELLNDVDAFLAKD